MTIRAVAALLSALACSGCFPKKEPPQKPPPPPVERPGVLPAPEPRETPPPPEQPMIDPRTQEVRAELQSRIGRQQELIAALGADLESQQAEINEQRQLLAFQGSQENALRQQRLAEISSQLLVSEQLLAARTIDLRNALGPVGDTWENPIVDGLRADVARLEAFTQGLRNDQATLQAEQQQSVADNVAQQGALLQSGRARQAAIAAALSDAKGELAALSRQLARAETPEPGPSG